MVAEKTVPLDNEYFRGMSIQVMTGIQYLGGFIGEWETEARWIHEKVEGCVESVRALAGLARKHPQSAYAGLQKSLQQDWAFMQRFTPG